MDTCTRCGDEHDTGKVFCPACFADPNRLTTRRRRGPVPSQLTCRRDHCTEEERAVINAAIADHETILRGTGTNADIDRVVATRGALTVAITKLVAARRKVGR